MHDDTALFLEGTATIENYTLSLHDALPISQRKPHGGRGAPRDQPSDRISSVQSRDRRKGARARSFVRMRFDPTAGDRKSTRLNSSHANISYAVFCLKQKIQLTAS